MVCRLARVDSDVAGFCPIPFGPTNTGTVVIALSGIVVSGLAGPSLANSLAHMNERLVSLEPRIVVVATNFGPSLTTQPVAF